MVVNATHHHHSTHAQSSYEVDWHLYGDLLPLKDRFWIDPEDLTRVRSIPSSSYMKTEIGNLNGTPVLIKSMMPSLDVMQNDVLLVVDRATSKNNNNNDNSGTVQNQMRASAATSFTSPARRKALVSEIIVMTRLSHPNIVTFLGFNITSEYGVTCVSEFMNKKTLRDLLNDPKQFPQLTWRRDKISIAIDICAALAYMHALRPALIHRNIKASKVLMNTSMQAKLSGFGSARDRTFESEMTIGVSDVQWSAPECLMDGEDYTEQVDVYSFGIVLTELDTGQMPFAAEMAQTTKADIMMKLVTGALRPQLSPTCPPEIVKIIKQCLQHDAYLRPRSEKVLWLLKQAHVDMNHDSIG